MSAAAAKSPMRTESQTGKKKKAKADASDNNSVANSATPSANAEPGAGTNAGEGPNSFEGKEYQSPYVRDLHKSIRNLTKKINATAKVDSILAENPGVSLDDLVASRKINNDQKAQALKKPSLQVSLAQLEEQVAQFKKVEDDYQAHLSSEKAALQASHQAELEAVRQQVREEAQAEAQKESKQAMLILSKFLRLAAARRQEAEGEPLTPERKALEGLLLMVYGGDQGAVQATEKLVKGVDEQVLSTTQEPVEFTYAQVKEAAVAYEHYDPGLDGTLGDAEQAYPSPPPEESEPPITTTDPTIANAGLTEISAMETQANAVQEVNEAPSVPQQSTIDAGAANEAAETHWDGKLSASAETTEEWVQVPRDPAETDTGVAATPAAATGTQSWADDHPESAPVSSEPATTAGAGRGDGFHEVHHSRGGRGRGGYRARGDFGGYRGRGFRGDRGSRGRGGYRGRGRDGDNQRRGGEAQ